MIICDLRDQLGNQLFSYASIKTMCLDRGLAFRWYVTPSPRIGSNDATYGNRLDRAFAVDLAERVHELPPAEVPVYQEPWPRPNTNYLPEVAQISDGTLIRGHFECPRYFAHRDDEVRQWFAFVRPLRQRMEDRFAEIRREAGDSLVVAVHARRGHDYEVDGRMLDVGYYRNAVEALGCRCGSRKMQFVLFSDVMLVPAALGLPKAVMPRGTLIEDLCLMSMCDAHIVSNSTFAWWAAWLHGPGHGLVVRPSVYPVDRNGYYPLDIYPPEWMTAEARRARPTMRARWCAARSRIGGVVRWLVR